MTIRKISRGYSNRLNTGSQTPPDQAGAQVVDRGRRFSEAGQRFFADVGFPAHRDDIYASAVAHGAPRTMVEAIGTLPDKVYRNADELPNLYDMAGIEDITETDKRS